MLMRISACHDPVFPDLEAALDPCSAARGFAVMLEARGFATQSLECKVERVRLKRGKKALIGYRLTGLDAAGKPIDQRVMLSLFPQNSAARLKDMGGIASLSDPAFGPPTAEVDALGGRAWFFPNDRKVHHIAALLNGLPPEVAEPGDVIESEIVHYVPEQGCTIRLLVDNGACFYGKCRADDRGATAWVVHRNARGTSRLRLAEAIAYDPYRRIFWQRSVAGAAIDPEHVRARPLYWAPRVSEAITAFNALPPPKGLKTLGIGRIVETIASRTSRSSVDMPDLSVRLKVVAARLAATRPDMPNVLLHCDLHPANMLWDGASFALIDLDTVAVGPGGLDHGSFVAALVHKAVEAQARDVTIVRMIDAFRRAFGGEEAFDWFVAASLMGERLYRCGTRLKGAAAGTRNRLLVQAERLVAHCG
jgi:Phosphotransferase enzyme family